MKSRFFALAAVFVAFTVYSSVIVFEHGYFGFLELGLAGGWGSQLFIDLCIALTLFAGWMFPDAKQRGIIAWPYFAAMLSLGSIGALAYLVHRELRSLKTASRATATA